MAVAAQALDSGAAKAKLEDLITASNDHDHSGQDRRLQARGDRRRQGQSCRPTEIEARAKDAAAGARLSAPRWKTRRSAANIGLIAEIKKASPSKGLIRADFDPPALAEAYEEGGAACLSVLTDTPSFQGAPEYLTEAREVVRLPVLRKDFMLEPYQVAEARSWGADCILVIMAMVDDGQARALMDEAARWDMDALVEVHDEAELERALDAGRRPDRHQQPQSQDLRHRSGRDPAAGATHSAQTVHVVAESGLSAPADLKRLAGAHVTTVLVGESLMRQKDVDRRHAAVAGQRLSMKDRLPWADRRSAGMRGRPAQSPRREHRPPSRPRPRRGPKPRKPERVSTSRYAKAKSADG